MRLEMTNGIISTDDWRRIVVVVNMETEARAKRALAKIATSKQIAKPRTFDASEGKKKGLFQ